MPKTKRRRRDSRVVVRGGYAGEDRQNAKLTRALVDAVLEMREDHGLSYGKLQQFLLDWHGVVVSIRCIRKIVKYESWVSNPLVDF